MRTDSRKDIHKADHTPMRIDAGDTLRRVEIITGVGRRRRWSEDEKARIVEESLAPGANISEVARRHDISRSLLFQWRRQLRSDGPSRDADASSPPFVPVMVAEAEASEAPAASETSSVIEIEVGDIRIRVKGRVDGSALRAVMNVVRATR